ncbi:unnamed protein product [Bursaphelenchus xylophilus]|uniref:(pine wood nematode) hypothetical protein n=1 Tax=Bursaphelenchus xylophilus TaxID=6326 RepID=A0A1I7SFR0_BURXY|nr:unnamed protein product [Bursaphelenchus xylophilus]CAG9111837.1 unnamed protein product [Bursaphelenchus xylophilus]
MQGEQAPFLIADSAASASNSLNLSGNFEDPLLEQEILGCDGLTAAPPSSPECPSYQQLYPEAIGWSWNFWFCGYSWNVDMRKQPNTMAPQPSVIRFRGENYEYPVKVIGIDLKIWLRLLSIINIFIVLGFSFLAIRIEQNFLWKIYNINSVFQSFTFINGVFLMTSAINFCYQMHRRHLWIDPRYEDHAVVNFTWIFISLSFIPSELQQEHSSAAFCPPSLLMLVLHLANYIMMTNASSYVDVKYCWLSEKRKEVSYLSTPLDRDYFYWHELFSRKGLGINKKLNICGYACTLLNISFMAIMGVNFVSSNAYIQFVVWGMLTAIVTAEFRAYTYQDKNCFYYAMSFVTLYNFLMMAPSLGKPLLETLKAVSMLFGSFILAFLNTLYYQELQKFHRQEFEEIEMTTWRIHSGSTTTYGSTESSNSPEDG